MAANAIWTAANALLCLRCASAAFIPGDVGPPPDPCIMDDSQSKVATTALACLSVAESPPAPDGAPVCDATAGCVARALASLTDECDSDGQHGHAAAELCNKATASFVFVETFRRLAASARDAKHKCGTAARLRRLVAACEPAHDDGADEMMRTGDEYESLVMAGRESYREDATDALVRRASVLLGGMDSVAGEMAALSRRRLLHGTIAVAVTFALPGLLAACSLAHARLVAVVQLCCVGLVFCYVRAQHGLTAGVAVATCCIVVLMLQFGLLAYLAGRLERSREGGLWLTTKPHDN